MKVHAEKKKAANVEHQEGIQKTFVEGCSKENGKSTTNRASRKKEERQPERQGRVNQGKLKHTGNKVTQRITYRGLPDQDDEQLARRRTRGTKKEDADGGGLG